MYRVNGVVGTEVTEGIAAGLQRALLNRIKGIEFIATAIEKSMNKLKQVRYLNRAQLLRDSVLFW